MTERKKPICTALPGITQTFFHSLRSSFRNVLLITTYIIGYLLCAIFYSYKLISTHLSIAHLFIRKTRSTTSYIVVMPTLISLFFHYGSIQVDRFSFHFRSHSFTLILIHTHTHTLRTPND